MTVLSATVHRARRAHRCIWCGEAIDVGTQYHRSKVVGDGTINGLAWHLECVKQACEVLEPGEDFIPHCADRPKRTT